MFVFFFQKDSFERRENPVCAYLCFDLNSDPEPWNFKRGVLECKLLKWSDEGGLAISRAVEANPEGRSNPWLPTSIRRF